jgi:precorrin-6Y C5,15-methyltransferase (decarboxylating)
MITVVGIGADGWAGLAGGSRDALRAARTIVGSGRQLDLLPAEVVADREPWPSPLEPRLVEWAARAADDDVCVLASGDPMLHGIGASLIRRAGADHVRVLPHPSAFALACARLGWPAAEVELVSAVGRPTEVVAVALQPGRRFVAYVSGADGAAGVARVLRDHGLGSSRLVVLEQLGGPDEQLHDTTADGWATRDADPLHAVAVEVRGGPGLPRTPGLPDDAFVSDGQLTKRHVRALTVAALAPNPGERLWDVGAGTGSVAIEWLRAEPTAQAVAIEAREDRAARIAENALSLGVPRLDVRTGRAPDVLADLPAPDVVFVGGGITGPGVLAACWDALPVGGRLVANVVTLEGDRLVATEQARRGGSLTRIDIAHAAPIGGFTGWRAQMTVTQWAVRKTSATDQEDPA